MDDEPEVDASELWMRHLMSHVIAIRGLLWWVVALLVAVVVAVAIGAYAIVTAVNELGPESPF